MHLYRVIEGDEFIKNLWAVHQKVKAEGYTQASSGHSNMAECRLTCISRCPWACFAQITWFTKT